MKKKRTARAAVRLAAAALSFLLLELGLRAGAAVFLWHRLSRPAEAGLRILCVGDSFTFGIGAPKGRGYPEQLEALLRAAGADVGVVNGGRPSFNSSEIAGLLESQLEESRPRIVVVTTGFNNKKLRNSSYALFRPPQTWSERLSRVAELSRVLALARLAWRRSRASAAEAPPDEASRKLAWEQFRRAEALAARGERDAAAALWGGAARLSGGLLGADQLSLYDSELHPPDPAVLRRALDYDLERMRRLAVRYGAVLVLQSYPYPAREPSLDGVVSEFARRRGLLYVDQRPLFSGRSGIGLFAPDGHLNAKGYGVMARHLERQLRSFEGTAARLAGAQAGNP